MRPQHIAIIPDGNRRWAKKHGATKLEAYDKGIDNIANVLKWCKKYKIKTLTMWGFSTENFMRDRQEVRGLFDLFNKKLSEGLKHDYKKYNARVRFLGQISSFPRDVQEKMRKAEKDTEKNGKYTLNLMLAYGGRQEILDAVQKAIAKGLKKVDEKTFSSLLYMEECPDLVIRTSGEQRTSGFLPWQSSYSEFYFSKKLWPDFNEREFRRALSDYAKRRRKYGK
ncbi:Tritrans,polycis-undecaprenyl-diphosphate synthase (GGDP specific) [uncultured archaeon]|nr:Tritrans,polycis-undecaprenyl-diphosphate synthase (GGDP specific) [uncultured archaeon]